MTAVSFNHLGQEGLEHPEVSHGVDFNDLSDFSLGVLEQIMLWHNSGIIHKDRYGSDVFKDLAASFQNFLAICHVDSKTQILLVLNFDLALFVTREFVDYLEKQK